MAFGESARHVFGAELVRRFASVASDEALRHMVSGDYLSASFSAAHAVRLSGRKAWALSDEDEMVAALGDGIVAALKGGRNATAGTSAAFYRMLTEAQPWPEDEVAKMRDALATPPRDGAPSRLFAQAHQLACYLVLGGPVFWTEDELYEMRTEAISAFKLASGEGHFGLAAERMAIFDVIEEAIEVHAAP